MQMVSNPANIHLDEDVFRFHFQKTSSRRLDQDEYIHFTDTYSEDVLVKTNVFVQDQYFILAIRLQDLSKTLSRLLQDVLQKRLQEVVLEVVIVRRLQGVLEDKRRLKDQQMFAGK